MITQETWAEICPVFAQRFPEEAVVAVWEDGTWKELRNVHDAPEGEFELTPEDTCALLARPPHVLIHSHCNGNSDPSDVDSLVQIGCGFAWGVTSVSGVVTNHGPYVSSVNFPVFWGDTVPRQPLLGRSYQWVVSDCFTLFRHYYAEQGIIFDDVPRIQDPDIKDEQGNPIYPPDHYAHRYIAHWIERLGFKPIERHERKPGDACVRRSGDSRHLDHCSVWLGNGKYLDISLKRTSHEYIPDDDDAFMRVTGARFYRWKGRS